MTAETGDAVLSVHFGANFPLEVIPVRFPELNIAEIIR
jgi:hypothetical protein